MCEVISHLQLFTEIENYPKFLFYFSETKSIFLTCYIYFDKRTMHRCYILYMGFVTLKTKKKCFCKFNFFNFFFLHFSSDLVVSSVGVPF